MDLLHTLTMHGQEQISFPVEKAYSRKEHRGFIVSLEYYGPTGSKVDACVCIWPAREGFEQGVWIIGRKRIADYTTGQTATPTAYCISEAWAALPVLNVSQTKQDCRNLVDALMSAVDDLIHMPAVPMWARREASGSAMWEVEHKDKATGKVLREASV